MKYGFFITAIMVIVLFSTCKKKKTNKNLYAEATASNLAFYKGMDTIYAPAGGSPHGNFKLKFNSAAQSQLDATGKLPASQSFNDGALIVKEVYSGSQLTLYAVMKKDSKSKFASNGWIWAEYEPGGKVRYDVSKKGDGCVSCHTTGDDRDLVRSFDLH
jgi:hypothetical protein